MKILSIANVYNEINFLKYRLKWSKYNQFDLFIVDNMSNDGTYEFLKQHQIAHSRIDTDGAFHLFMLQEEINKKIHEIKPDWVIYHGADMFYFSENGCRYDIERADSEGYELLATPSFVEMRNTGRSLSLVRNTFKLIFSMTVLAKRMN